MHPAYFRSQGVITRLALHHLNPHPTTPPSLQGLLDEVQDSLLRQAREFRDANIVDVSSYEELQAAVAEGALGGRAA